jgi:MerR family transcriptional regulator, thiopeptide resistance regulator
MSYTVRKLSKLSGVSVRTLHWYDEIGLLKPAYYGENGYRYYEEEQLLTLQQILFFRELGFPLKDIQKILGSNDFDTIRALLAHKKTLEEGLNRTKKLVGTVVNTINHLRGKQKMKDKEFYKGFDAGKSKGYEPFLANYQGTVAEDIISESKQATQERSPVELESLDREGHETLKDLAKCMSKGLDPKSDEVQEIIHKRYQLAGRVHEVNKDIFLSYAQMYCDHPDFQKWFDEHYPNLTAFLAEAMRVYAYSKLS